jgi:hypothetical protein
MVAGTSTLEYAATAEQGRRLRDCVYSVRSEVTPIVHFLQITKAYGYS